MRIRAHCLGERLDVRGVVGADVLAWAPALLQPREGVWALLFRYGAVVVAGMTTDEEDAFLASIAPAVTRSYEAPQTEELTLSVDPKHEEGLDAQGGLRLAALDAGRLQVVAEVMAKSTALAHYEAEVSGVIGQLEPLVEGVRLGRRTRTGKTPVMSQLGRALSTQARITGRIQATEKPEITWEDPDLDRLYERLAAEFELADRDRALTRKTDLISDSAGLLIGMAQHRQTLRVEWYIVILILVEIALLLFDLSTR